MRLIGWLLLALMGLCWLASEVSFQQAETFESQWRRTVDGWERKIAWSRDPAAARPEPFHPVLIGTLQGVLGVGALLAFSNREASSGSKRPAEPEGLRRGTDRGSYRFLRMKPARPPLRSGKSPTV